MTSLPFLSRHPPTSEERSVARRLGFDDVVQHDVTLSMNAPAELASWGLSPDCDIAIVAPLYVGLALLRAGYRLVEFVNAPDARQSGRFHCTGAYRHTLSDSVHTPADDRSEAGL